MENKGCITCRKCEQIRSNFFCGRTRLSQKQLYNKHGFCSDYEPKEQIEKPMTNEEWLRSCTTQQLAEFLYDIAYFDNWSDVIMNDSLINETAVEDAIELWLKQQWEFKEWLEQQIKRKDDE